MLGTFGQNIPLYWLLHIIQTVALHQLQDTEPKGKHLVDNWSSKWGVKSLAYFQLCRNFFSHLGINGSF